MAHLLRGARRTGGCDRLGRTGRSLLAAEHGLLEGLGDREADLLGGGDLDRLARLGIAADAGLHLPQAEDAESRDLESLALLHRLHDVVDQRGQEIVGLLAAHPSRFRELRHQLRLRHRSTSVGVTWCGEIGTAAPYADASADVNVVRIYQGVAVHRSLAVAADARWSEGHPRRRRPRTPARAAAVAEPAASCSGAAAARLPGRSCRFARRGVRPRLGARATFLENH